MRYIDIFLKGSDEFNKLEKELFKSYVPTFTMELEDYYKDTKIYRIKGVDKVTCHYNNGNLTMIVVDHNYYS